jgi:hypothetical protein
MNKTNAFIAEDFIKLWTVIHHNARPFISAFWPSVPKQMPNSGKRIWLKRVFNLKTRSTWSTPEIPACLRSGRNWLSECLDVSTEAISREKGQQSPDIALF